MSWHRVKLKLSECAKKKSKIQYCTIVIRVVALNQAANDGWAPMRIAACNGDSETMEVLSSPHTDLSQAINKGNTPLKLSAQFGKKETATVLRSLAHVPLVRQRGRPERSPGTPVPRQRP